MAIAKVLLAKPRGFCAGVDRAIEIVELALQVYGPPIYVRHEIVHNRHVVEDLRAKGAVFVEDLADVPGGSLVIFSAHGVSPGVRDEARERGVRTLDATCPLVAKVHVEALRYARDGYDIALVGHRGHVEVEGTLGHAPSRMRLIETVEDAELLEVKSADRVAVLTQTTLSVDDTKAVLRVLKGRFPNITVPAKDDICYATQNRQDAVKAIARDAEVILVIGARNSSNSIRLVEVAEKAGCRAYLISDADEISPAWFDGVSCVGVTSGASAPEHLVQDVVASLKRLGAKHVEVVDVAEEDVSFRLPLELIDHVPN